MFSDQKYNADILKIYKLVCDYYNIPIKEANTESRISSLKTCRQVAHYIIKKTLQKTTLSQIGAVVGNKDHATVMNSIRIIENSILPLRNGFIPDRSLRRDISILMFKAGKIVEDVEDNYYASMGTMITDQN